MHRSLVALRCAELTDVPALADLWADSLRRADRQEQLADLELIVKGASESPEQRVVVAEHDGRIVGAVLLRVTTLSAVNLEPTVQALSLQVVPEHRRHGIGRTLMEAAVGFAEELGIAHLTTAAISGSRDANRFMSRLALGPQAVLRVASTHTVRAKLTAQRPAHERGGRQLTQVLAARRSQRRAQAE